MDGKAGRPKGSFKYATAVDFITERTVSDEHSECLLFKGRQILPVRFRIHGISTVRKYLYFFKYRTPMPKFVHVRMTCSDDRCIAMSHMKEFTKQE